MNDLDSIDERAQHVCNGVGCANEDALTHVEFEVEITVAELIRLLWVQELEQG